MIAEASEQTVRQSSEQLENVISNAVSGLLEDIGAELKDSSRLSLPNDLTPLFQSLDFLDGEKSISLDSRGDGIKARYIPLILKFIAERSRDAGGMARTFIWAYEEPENNLEFRRAQALADAFHQLAESELSQVLLTTHSPVFYNMHKDDDGNGLCSAYHLTKHGPAIGTEARSAKEASVSLDESMGAMAIIAPHIKAAQLALDEATSQAADLKLKLERFNEGNLPTLFVEGATDYAVFKKLLEVFRPDKLKKIYLAEPPQRAGANYVANMLRSWEFRTKHLPFNQRGNAVGVVDADAAGDGAIKRFSEAQDKWNHVTLLRLETPAHLKNAHDLGFAIPITLEELWPLDVWKFADQKGWLTEREKKGLYGEKLLQRLTEKDERLSDLIDDTWRIYFEKRVNDTQASTAKADWVKYVTTLASNKLEPLAASHLEVLDHALAKLIQ